LYGRCRLPSGKIVWLCEKHQHEEHVAKLSIDSRGSSHNYVSVLFNEDKFLLEQLEKSEEYKRLKAIKSNKVGVISNQSAEFFHILNSSLVDGMTSMAYYYLLITTVFIFFSALAQRF
jgi:hypothetical protein